MSDLVQLWHEGRVIEFPHKEVSPSQSPKVQFLYLLPPEMAGKQSRVSTVRWYQPSALRRRITVTVTVYLE